ncbi:hypothetical protein AB4524_14560, partial [Vibrio breoganii]
RSPIRALGDDSFGILYGPCFSTSSSTNRRHTGKHPVFIQYLGLCESQPWALSKILNQVQDDALNKPKNLGP